MNTQYNSSYIFSITLVATLGGLLFGYDTAVISGTVESLNTVFVAPQNLSESAANSLLGFLRGQRSDWLHHRRCPRWLLQ